MGLKVSGLGVYGLMWLGFTVSGLGSRVYGSVFGFCVRGVCFSGVGFLGLGVRLSAARHTTWAAHTDITAHSPHQSWPALAQNGKLREIIHNFE